MSVAVAISAAESWSQSITDHEYCSCYLHRADHNWWLALGAAVAICGVLITIEDWQWVLHYLQRADHNQQVAMGVVVALCRRLIAIDDWQWVLQSLSVVCWSVIIIDDWQRGLQSLSVEDWSQATIGDGCCSFSLGSYVFNHRTGYSIGNRNRNRNRNMISEWIINRNGNLISEGFRDGKMEFSICKRNREQSLP